MWYSLLMLLLGCELRTGLCGAARPSIRFTAGIGIMPMIGIVPGIGIVPENSK